MVNDIINQLANEWGAEWWDFFYIYTYSLSFHLWLFVVYKPRQLNARIVEMLLFIMRQPMFAWSRDVIFLGMMMRCNRIQLNLIDVWRMMRQVFVKLCMLWTHVLSFTVQLACMYVFIAYEFIRKEKYI